MGSKLQAPVGLEFLAYSNNFAFNFSSPARAVGARLCFFSDENAAYAEDGRSVSSAAVTQVNPNHANLLLHPQNANAPYDTLLFLTQPLSQNYAKLVVTVTVNSYLAGTLRLGVQRFSPNLQTSNLYMSDAQTVPAGSPAVTDLTFEIVGVFNRGDVVAVQYDTSADRYVPHISGTWATVPVIKVYDSGDISTLAALVNNPLAAYLYHETEYAPGFSGTYTDGTMIEMVASLEANTGYIMRITGSQVGDHFFHVDTKTSTRADSGWGFERFASTNVSPVGGPPAFESVYDIPFTTGIIQGQTIMQLINSNGSNQASRFRRIQVYKAANVPFNSKVANLTDGTIYDTGPIRAASDLTRKNWSHVTGETGTTNADRAALVSGPELGLNGVRVNPNSWYTFEITGINYDPTRRSYLNFLRTQPGGGFLSNGTIIGTLPKVVDNGNDSVYKFWWNSGPISALDNFYIALYRDNGFQFGVRRIRLYGEIPPA